MIAQSLEVMKRAIEGMRDLFLICLDTIDAQQFVVALVGTLLVARLIIIPVINGGVPTFGSDKAQHKKQGKKDD